MNKPIVSKENIEKLLADLASRESDLYRSRWDHPEFEKFPDIHAPVFRESLPMFHEDNPALREMFSNFSKYIIEGSPRSPAKFEAKQGYLYHGTSASALHSILQDGVLYPSIHLIKQGRLVSGEMAKDVRDFENGVPCGPKFMSRAKMIEMGMISADDPSLYVFGHAFDVCFGIHPVTASSYTSADPNEKVIIGLDRRVAEMHGHSFINGGSEGILHEGPLEIWLSLKQLLVPDHRVEEFREKAREKYLTQVFPYSDFKL